jgi:hypothetical protein
VNHRRRASILLSALIAVIALSVQLPSASAESVATVVTTNGPADIEKVGDTVVGVTTGHNTTVIVDIDGTHEVTVYQNTELRLGDVLGLRVGTIRVRGSLTVATSYATTIVDDSEMTVAYDDTAGITTVEVTDGEAAVRGINGNSDERVPVGQMVRVGNDGRATAPQATSQEVAKQITGARIAPRAAGDSRGARARPYVVLIAVIACVLVTVVGARASEQTRNGTAGV